MNANLKLRYARQIAIQEIGLNGQQNLLNGRVLVIGCGALGSMVAMQLAGAGIGKIGIADFDTVDISNLQRQFFFKTQETGQSKVEVLEKSIRSLNPDIEITTYNGLITSKKAEEIFPYYDFIVDATDNPDSKQMTGVLSQRHGLPCNIGGVRDFNGQVITLLPKDPRFEEYIGNVPSDGFLPCSLSGVIGPAAALCASVQASEVIKYFTHSGILLSGRLLIFDLLKNTFHTFTI